MQLKQAAKTLFLSVLMAVILTGCSAVYTSVAKGELDVQTKMTRSIFLDPVPKAKRIVYVNIRNTSDKPNLAIEMAVKQKIVARGYQLTDDPQQANFWLQANVLKVGRHVKGQHNHDGSAMAGAAIGSTMGEGDGEVFGAVVGGLIATMIDASVQDTYYEMVTDIRISQRVQSGEKVTESESNALPQGTSGQRMSSSTRKTDWLRYQTSIVSVANKANLSFAEAEQPLISGLVQSIGNIF